MAADLAREKTCITPRAAFRFHKARYQKQYRVFGFRITYVVGFTDPDHSDSIESWILQHGGYPYFGMLTMGYKDALAFWQPCRFKST